MSDLLCHIWNSLLLAGIVVFYTAVAEEVGKRIAHDVVKFVQRTVCLLRILCIVDSLIMPVLVESHEVVVTRQNLLLQSEMLFVEHPVSEILFIDKVVAIVAVTLFVGKSLVLTPVVVLELVEHTFSDSVCDVLQYAELRIHNTLDSDRVYLLGSGNRDAAGNRIRISCLVIFEGKIVHVLIFVSAYDIRIYLVRIIDEENSGKKIIADYLRQFCERIDSKTILVYIAVDSQTVGYTLYTVRVVVCFSTTRYVLWLPCTSLQSVELIEGSVAVLVISSLVHIALRKIHFRHHCVY